MLSAESYFYQHSFSLDNFMASSSAMKALLRTVLLPMCRVTFYVSTANNFLRLPEFIELIKAGQKLEAVKHARKHLASDDPEHFQTIQKGMALLAFSGGTTIQPYRDLLSDDRFDFSVN